MVHKAIELAIRLINDVIKEFMLFLWYLYFLTKTYVILNSIYKTKSLINTGLSFQLPKTSFKKTEQAKNKK